MASIETEKLEESIERCDQEPIHALGFIQPHGALLCFDPSGLLLAKSRNAEALLGPLPSFGDPLTSKHLSEPVRRTLHDALSNRSLDGESVECLCADAQRFDVIVHWSANTLFAEFEKVADDAPAPTQFALFSQRAIRRIQTRRHESVHDLLQAAADAIRTMTGFDRVMSYRFLSDGSGEVIAEARRDDLPSYLHQRYPAGDVPEQARRLYVLNPIRQIASIAAPPVPIDPPIHPRTGRPYDLSHSVLRSVSPIHIEYLTNMGVAASMSISVIVNGKLWGLFACHHMTPYRTSHAVRLSCTVLTEVVSLLITQIDGKRRTDSELRIADSRTKIAMQLNEADDPLAGMLIARHEIAGLVDNEAVWVIADREVLALGPQEGSINRDAMLALADEMERRNRDIVVTASLSADMPDVPAIHTPTGIACGCLAIQITGDKRITLAWLRDEFVDTIHWAGPLDKVIAQGPHGPRLTPRGSFEVWKQTVRGKSREWTDADYRAVRELRAVLQEIALNQMRDAERARTTLMATLGHDLRDPLQAINVAVQLMGRGKASSSDTAKRVEGSTRRMQSLITYILDVSRIRSGLGLGMTRAPVGLIDLLQEVVEQTGHTHPGVAIEARFASELGTVSVDADRLSQALGNLIGNARHHGDMTHPVRIEAGIDDGDAVIRVVNRLTKKVEVSFERLINPFKSGSLDNPNNRGGMGLGLFIANAIVKGHGGVLTGTFSDTEAVFVVRLPRLAALHV